MACPQPRHVRCIPPASLQAQYIAAAPLSSLLSSPARPSPGRALSAARSPDGRSVAHQSLVSVQDPPFPSLLGSLRRPYPSLPSIAGAHLALCKSRRRACCSPALRSWAVFLAADKSSPAPESHCSDPCPAALLPRVRRRHCRCRLDFRALNLRLVPSSSRPLPTTSLCESHRKPRATT
ncbi:hypothetical protein BS50DRAFT_277894 [Corynespora cassiicola Philippines]|uniref:Uncharacterized protein n=1 Tax=Corynespora cassiicola Philippines TaxID=1448308 RepID=A0A2T2P0L2_CORCC|nr:hypothetical protein BS50DRAFT_277894 [Corynespora cassiicola Philippines]